MADRLERTFSFVNGDSLETAVALAARLTEAATETGRMPSDADVPARVRSLHTFSGLAISVSGDGADDLGEIVSDEQFSETTGDAYFQLGKLKVSGNGFLYELDAANGDPATFLLNVTEDGVTTSYTVPWSSRFDLNEFDPLNVEVGLQQYCAGFKV